MASTPHLMALTQSLDSFDAQPLAFDHPITDETRMPITRASAQLVEQLYCACDGLQDLRAEFAGAMS